VTLIDEQKIKDHYPKKISVPARECATEAITAAKTN